MVLFIICLFSVIFFLIAWIVFVPIHSRINTDLDRYELSQLGTLMISVQPGIKPFYKIKLLGFEIHPSNHPKVRHSEPKKKKKNAGIKRSSTTWIFLFRGVLQSFRVKRITLDIDMDDVVLNAQLVPILLLVSGGPVRMQTNFNHRNYLDLDVEGRIDKILWTLIRFLTKK